MSVEMVELSVKSAGPLQPAGTLQQSRIFLDFFWDLAEPDQEVRLKAVENLILYLKSENKVRLNLVTVDPARSSLTKVFVVIVLLLVVVAVMLILLFLISVSIVVVLVLVGFLILFENTFFHQHA